MDNQNDFVKEQNDVEKELKKFNWGAAYLGLIWSAVNGCFGKWFLENFIIIFILSLIIYGLSALIGSLRPDLILYNMAGSFAAPFIILLVSFIYSGIKGNKWAWNASGNKDLDEFKHKQKPWNIVAIVLFSLSMAGLILNFLFLSLLFGAVNDTAETEQPPKYISSEYCKVIQEILPDTLKQLQTGSDDMWVFNFGEQLGKNDKILFATGHSIDNSVNIEFKTERIGREEIEFKIAHNTPCSLEEKNCYISAPVQEETYACMFFFDDKGNIELSNKTQTFLNK